LDFEIPENQIVAKIRTARMISPTARKVDMPIENGFVGMVDRENFDDFLRKRACNVGATQYTGTFLRIERLLDQTLVHYKDKKSGKEKTLQTRAIIAADGARSNVVRAEIPGGRKIPYVIAYHEIIKAPIQDSYDPDRCDVIYDGKISPDFYGWVFPHGKLASVGMGTGVDGIDLKAATLELRKSAGLAECETVRREGAPIPLRPLDKWDNGKDLVLAGDAAGVVAPSSGEGIYYAMVGGQEAANATFEFLETANPAKLKLARKRFMAQHKTVFKVLGAMQNAYYRSDDRRERFVSLCKDKDVQKLTFEAYMHKKLVRTKPLAHLRIMAKNLAHLTGVIKATT
jgi:geranylgeranyl reductase